uniref:UPAR/Ly6 domain-containing protein n=1 Tax=Angiostrongylus cantonensis TaxID=6313 RepID=A0A0K0D4Q8_ANGCA
LKWFEFFHVSASPRLECFHSVNFRHAVSHYEPQLKLKSYCRTEVVFGIESTICYCRDGDFCNMSPPSLLNSLVVIILSLFQRIL